MPKLQQRITRHAKKQGNVVHAKEQNKPPETDTKEI
jgi:hypothetical protein